MTVVACDGKWVYTDSLTTHSDGQRNKKPFKKLHKVDGKTVAFTGCVAPWKHLLKWLKDGADPARLPPRLPTGWQMIVFDKDDAYVYNDELLYPDTHEYPCAFGSGAVYAIGALYAGATLQRATQAAIDLDTSCGGRIQKSKV